MFHWVVLLPQIRWHHAFVKCRQTIGIYVYGAGIWWHIYRCGWDKAYVLIRTSRADAVQYLRQFVQSRMAWDGHTVRTDWRIRFHPVELLRAAHMYQMDVLKNECERCLRVKFLTRTMLADFWNLPRLTNCRHLEKCNRSIDGHQVNKGFMLWHSF